MDDGMVLEHQDGLMQGMRCERPPMHRWQRDVALRLVVCDVADRVASPGSRVAVHPQPGRVREPEFTAGSDAVLQRLDCSTAITTFGLGNVRGW